MSVLTTNRRRQLLSDAASFSLAGPLATIGANDDSGDDRRQGLPTISASQLRALRAQQEERERRNNNKYGLDSPLNPENALNAYRGSGYAQMNEFARLFFTPSAKNYQREGFLLDSPLVSSNDGDDDQTKEKTRELFEYYNADGPLLRFTSLLNDAILNSPLPVPVLTYRGIRDLSIARPAGKVDRTIGFGKTRRVVTETRYESLPLQYFQSQLQVGNVVRFYGFLSTSLNPNVAVATKLVGINNKARMMMDLPQYTDSTAQCCFLQFQLPSGYPALYTRAMSEEELILPYKLSNGDVPEFLVTNVFRVRHLYRGMSSALFDCDPNDDTRCTQEMLSKREDAPKAIDLTLVRLQPL